MKEFLDTAKLYTYVKDTAKRSEDWIEIPEGAELLTACGLELIFWKNEGKLSFHVENSSEWDKAGNGLCDLNGYFDKSVSIVWKREKVEVEVDNVNHPKHYTGHPSGIECIEITRHHDFAIGNAIKYLWRAGLKDSDNEIQDLEKAVWYIQDKIKQLKGG